MIFFLKKELTTAVKTYRLPLFFGAANGPLTQLVEYLPFKQRVAGSSPARPTTHSRFGKKYASPSSSPVQDTGLSRRRQGFESPWGRHFYLGKRNRNAFEQQVLLRGYFDFFIFWVLSISIAFQLLKLLLIFSWL